MRTLLIVGLLVASLAASGCAGEAPKAASVRTLDARPLLQPGKGAIEGYVVDEALDGLAGARVRIEGLGLELRTNDVGYYYAGPIALGQYQVRASHGGFVAHAVTTRVQSAEVALVVFVLRPVFAAGVYEVKSIQEGFVACAMAVASSGTAALNGAIAPIELDCGLPDMRKGGGSGTSDGPVEAEDRSVQRWVLDEPSAVWRSALMQTRWSSGHELARQLRAEIAVEGCTDDARRFARSTGASPIVQNLTQQTVRLVLERAEGSTCTVPGERCDEESCVLSSRLRPTPSGVGQSVLRMGAAVQQAYEQELTAVFGVVPETEGQTLK
jgi:hypothetical protein